MLGSLASVNKASGYLNDDLVDRGPVLLLEEQLRPRGFGEDGNDAYTIDFAIGRAGLVNVQLKEMFREGKGDVDDYCPDPEYGYQMRQGRLGIMKRSHVRFEATNMTVENNRTPPLIRQHPRSVPLVSLCSRGTSPLIKKRLSQGTSHDAAELMWT